MKKWLIWFCLVVVCVSGRAEQPNVMFIFADDLSYEAIGAFGMLDIDTPNLDRLVERGTTFSHAYNMGAWGGAVCVASRAMLNTGRFVWQAKAVSQPELVADHRMWSQRMHQAGYKTYMTGKWHVKTSAPDIFDVALNVRGGMPKQVPAGYNRPKNEADYAAGWKPWDPKHGGFWEGGTHWSEVVANDSIAFLEDAAESEKPFFMYLAFNAAHDPRQAPKEYVDRYPLSRIQMPENFLDEYPYAEAICGKKLRDERLMPYPRTEYAVKVNRQEYFALITHMDDQIGRILDALEASGKADSTYIFFTADHGLAVGHHGLVGKQNMYDHSVRVPFMVVGPDIVPGKAVETPIYLQDVVPTSLELAGAPREGVDFESLLPLLKGEQAEHYGAVYGAYMNRQRMITQGDWKLVSYPEIGVERLFNLKKDPNEMNDLSGNPEAAPQLQKLRLALEDLSKELGDPLQTGSAPAKRKKRSMSAAKNGTLLLKASDAVLNPSPAKKIQFNAKKDRIGSWMKPEATVQWTLDAEQPGRYAVSAEVASTQAASITLSLGEEQEIQCSVPSTGGSQDFQSVSLCDVFIDDAGTLTLTISPVKQGWRPINLRSVTLTPVK